MDRRRVRCDAGTLGNARVARKCKMGVRPSRHASRVSAADTRDPSVLGSETSASALRRAARRLALGLGLPRARLWYLPSIDVRAVKTRFTIFPGRVPGRQAASDHMPRCPLTTRHHPQRAPCGLRPRPARTHTPRSCQPTAHAARPPCLLMVTTSVLTCHTRVYVLGPHIRQFPVPPSARLCCTSAPRHARNRRSSAL